MLTLAATLDFEQQESYTLLIEATDSGMPPLKSKTALVVNVLDENDNAPEFTQQQYSVNMFENATAGQKLIQVR